MIQELKNKKLYNHYAETAAEKTDKVFCFEGEKIYIFNKDMPKLPLAEMFSCKNLQYLFCINEEKYFIYFDTPDLPNIDCVPVRSLRYVQDKEFVFALYTAFHLYQWYRDNQYCGRCGKKMHHDSKERMMRCNQCGNCVYPKISPAVIVAVTNGDKIVLTKYSGRTYKRYALIAGFTEIGETAEETVKREVMEEVGLHVKNIRYYKSQPWGTDSDLLLGFTCEVDGDNHINMDREELAIAEWVKREDMENEDDGLSLTGEMMRMFKENKL